MDGKAFPRGSDNLKANGNKVEIGSKSNRASSSTSSISPDPVAAFLSGNTNELDDPSKNIARFKYLNLDSLETYAKLHPDERANSVLDTILRVENLKQSTNLILQRYKQIQSDQTSCLRMIEGMDKMIQSVVNTTSSS